MNILTFDTSNNDNTSVTVSNEKNILSCLTDRRSSKQAEILVPMIEEAMRKASIDYSKVRYLGVSSGPGSFTGIRIGLATAKSIALSARIEPIAISSFDIAFNYAKNKVSSYDEIVVVLNAYKGQFYTQTFDRDNNSTVPIILNAVEMIDLLKESKKRTVCISKDLAPIYNNINILPNITILPRLPKMNSLYMCYIIRDLIESGRIINEPLEPLYVRPPDAIPPAMSK
ncbi:MAG: tRNA (adenosine(37)-N6)-threonylcarbamoyltransferase complex dimerization subunit type 1 TsaB [Janthinobacterium lividum]